MKSIVFEAEAGMSMMTAYHKAVSVVGDNISNIIAFTAFKVEGLWIVTITYK